ncbi:MAG: adenine nucleotide alpha hydrolase family protein [Deltaproteobacteria bacterium]|nr:adenine nucleotide alpha hydrolase family protein [Deltaproteobacteria bacterium]
MKCTRCREPAEVKVRAHNSAFCRECYVLFFERRVLRAIEHEKMFRKEERILVAISGGKDSLALWDVLSCQGYTTVGFHLALGIGGYSSRSLDVTRRFAESRGLELRVHALADEGLAVPDMMKATRRPACAACGTAKRHYFDAAALEFSCDVIATGHNLDDEAARLLGNVLHWQTDHLARQRPVMQPRHEKFVRKVKPLFLTSEYETASYAFLRGLQYVVEECPNAAGATQLTYKAMLDQLESTSPGTKLSFVREFVARGAAAFERPEGEGPGGTCSGCGMPSFGTLCSFCSLRAEVDRKLRSGAATRGDGASR